MYTLTAFMTALCGVYSSGVSRQDCLKHINAIIIIIIIIIKTLSSS